MQESSSSDSQYQAEHDANFQDDPGFYAALTHKQE